MNRIYIDTAALFAMVTLAEQGEEAHAKVGYAYDAHDQAYALFVGTDKETKKLQRDKNGFARLNVRAGSKRRSSGSSGGQTQGSTQGQEQG